MCLSHTLLFVKLFGTLQMCLQIHMFLTYIFIRCELGVARVCSLFHLTGHTNQFYRCTVLSTLHQVLSSAIYVCVTILAETISHTLPFHSHLYLEQCKCRLVHFLQITRLSYHPKPINSQMHTTERVYPDLAPLVGSSPMLG